MKIGFIGLGKMGGNMVTRLLNDNHQIVVLDPSKDAIESVVSKGAEPALDRQDLISKLEPTIVWMMIPSQYVDEELSELLKIVQPGSIIIDGGNSDFRLTQKRAELCQQKRVIYVDVGTSGGILGLENGYAMMVGGKEDAVNTITPILDSLAPPNGWNRFGESGAGHYVKMVHNAIEYGLMQSYAEGYRMLKDGPISNIDLAAAGEVWQHGSIIESLLNKITTEALQENPNLDEINGYVNESGETRWALETAKENNIELPIIQSSFDVRLDSQKGNINFATKLLAAMRNKFGGHAINKE